MPKNYMRIAQGLQRLIHEIGPLWPSSTKLAGFASDGPYNCAMCEYLNTARNRCSHTVMIMDPEVMHDKGLAVITDPEHQCCEFVERKKV